MEELGGDLFGTGPEMLSRNKIEQNIKREEGGYPRPRLPGGKAHKRTERRQRRESVRKINTRAALPHDEQRHEQRSSQQAADILSSG